MCVPHYYFCSVVLCNTSCRGLIWLSSWIANLPQKEEQHASRYLPASDSCCVPCRASVDLIVFWSAYSCSLCENPDTSKDLFTKRLELHSLLCSCARYRSKWRNSRYGDSGCIWYRWAVPSQSGSK